jgi:hypothetical protein
MRVRRRAGAGAQRSPDAPGGSPAGTGQSVRFADLPPGSRAPVRSRKIAFIDHRMGARDGAAAGAGARPQPRRRHGRGAAPEAFGGQFAVFTCITRFDARLTPIPSAASLRRTPSN